MKYTTLLPFLLASASSFAVPTPRAGERFPFKGFATRLDLPEEGLIIVDSDQPKYGWDKERPKKSLEDAGQGQTASQWILNTVEGVHWFACVPTFVSSYAIMKYHDVWFGLFNGDALRVMMWLLAPVVAMLGGGLAPIIAHVYEDWQVAPSKDPNTAVEYDGGYDPTVYGNERLREVSYSLLFTGLGVSAIMNFIAYQGLSPTTVVPGIGLFAYAVLANKRNLVSDYVTPFFDRDRGDSSDGIIKVLPVPVSVMVFFVFSQIVAFNFAILPLASLVDESHFALKLAIVLPLILSMLGGMLEGIVAEVKFDQRYHLCASLLMNLGVATQAWSYLKLGQILS